MLQTGGPGVTKTIPRLPPGEKKGMYLQPISEISIAQFPCRHPCFKGLRSFLLNGGQPLAGENNERTRLATSALAWMGC